jgi:hypothetical protein
MMNWLQGFLQFRAWLPEQLLGLVEPTGKVDSLHVRTLLSLAIAAFLWSFVARTLWGVGLALRDWLQGRRLIVAVATPISWAAWLVGAGAAILPWTALWLMSRQGRVSWGMLSTAATLALVWAALRIGERSRVFLLPAEDCLVVTRALPGLRVAEHRIPLGVLLPFAGPNAADHLQRDVAGFLKQQLGSDAAVGQYLRKVAKRRRPVS